MRLSSAFRDMKESLSDGNISVSVNNVSKSFKLPHQYVHTLKERALHPFRKYTFDQFWALKGIDFKVKDGEFFGIIGRNGSGKSTLLKCLAGIYRTNSGEIRVTGMLSPFIELGVGFNPDLSARDNILVNATLLGLTPKEAKANFDSIISYAELEDFIDLKFKNYSSGMQVRLGFASAIQVNAKILLVDEVLAVGDANFQLKCFETFRDLKRQGRTIIFVSHDMQTIERFCDRALYLEEGKVVDIAHPKTITREYLEANIERQRSSTDERRSSFESRPGEDRWGDGCAEIVDVTVVDISSNSSNVLKHGNKARIELQVKIHKPLDHPIISLLISADDDSRTVIFGTSTDADSIKTPRTSIGDDFVLGLTISNLLTEGRYYLSASIADQDGAQIADIRNYFYSFVVRGGTAFTSGSVDLPHITELSTRK